MTFEPRHIHLFSSNRISSVPKSPVLSKNLKYSRGVPARIYCDNGSEFVSGQTDQWAYTNGVKIEFSRLGKPTDNAVIESFNGRFRDECLNTHWFESLEDAKMKIDAWRWDYNEHRPHRSLEGLTPREFARREILKRAADSQS
jgi:putative transposase